MSATSACIRGTPSRANGTSPNNDDGSFSSPAQNGQTLNPIAAAQNAVANTDGGVLASTRNAAVAAGGATVAAGGAALAATKNAGSRAVGGEMYEEAMDTMFVGLDDGGWS